MEQYQLHACLLEGDIDGINDCILNGADINELDTQGMSPLHWAVMCGWLDMVKLLLESGADPNTFSSDGITPRWSAVDFGLTEIEDLLVLYGGKVRTGEGFDKISWGIFKGALGEDLPEDDIE